MHKKLRGKNWFVIKEEDKDIVKIINIHKYIHVGSWKNKEEQRELMINYKMDPNEIYKLSF